MVQLEGFLGRHLGPLLKTSLPLMKNVLKLLLKSNVLVPLGQTAPVSATHAAIQKRIFGLGMCSSDLAKRTTLIISNEEMDDIVKIAKSFEDAGVLLKGVGERIKNGGFLGRQRNKKVDFLV